ncbi:MAG TPA: hypothetical protein VFE14_09375, partial [Micromonosporaceae bacterium]|nr:hypothetical protein [Micromonosporaceae bacterium]
MSAATVLDAAQLATLADALGPALRDAVDVPEIVALLEASGLNDRAARTRFGADSVFTLGEALAMGRLVRAPRRPAPVRPRVVGPALARAALYLIPALLAVAAAEHLDRLPARVPAAGLVAGWAAAQGLAYLGYGVAGRTGRGAAARFLLAGFGALAALCCAATGVLVSTVDLWPALGVVLAELALFAIVAAAVVTGAVGTALRWSLPAVGISVVALTPWAGRWTGPALAGAVLLVLARAYAPAVARRRGEPAAWRALT